MPTNAAATGFWTAQNRNNARQGRALLQSIFLGASSISSPLASMRSGVVCTTADATNIYDLRVTVTSGLSMSVASGAAVVGRPGTGPYLGWLLPGAVTVTCDPAPVSNPRNDLVVMRVYDAAQGDTVPGTGPCQIEIITGTPGAVPVDPPTTGLAGGGAVLVLARAQVSTAGVITLTDLRRSTGLLGAVRPMLPGDLSGDGSSCQGDMRWNPALGLLEWYSMAGGWQRIASGDPVPRGTVAYGTSSTGSPANITTSDLMQAEVATGPVVSGRRYRIHHIRSEAGGNILTNTYRVQSGGSITLGGSTVVKATTDTTPGSYRTSTRFVFWVATFTGTATFGLSSRVNTGTNTVDGAVVREVLVEDIGV
ncbi:hypothetical protein [Amycolatopsis japonica]